MLVLDVKPRGDKESPELLRNDGFIPAVLYGPKEAAVSISVDARSSKAPGMRLERRPSSHLRVRVQTKTH